MTELVMHLVRTNGSPTAARERIERVLEVKTEARPDGGGAWMITWKGPKLPDEAFDFLRPDVLPPRE